jgi:DNA repair protein RecN (Recombination protein N)
VLEELRISGLGVISDAVLEFGPGLTVVTGETGAGKTMVLSGLALLFGGRADYSRLRPGFAAASVEGRLLVGPDSAAAHAVVEAGGDLEDDGALLLRRVIGANGRSRAAAGGASVPATLLSRLSEGLLAVHGQSDQQRLTRPGEQRLTLDRYAALDLATCRAAFAEWRAAVAELERRSGQARELQREAELLRHGINEVQEAAPRAGEDEELTALTSRLEHVDALRLAAHTAHGALLGDPDDPAGDVVDAQSLVGTARRALSQVAGADPDLDRIAQRLTELIELSADVGAELADYEAQLEVDPQRLAAVHERRAVLSALARKYGPTLADVLSWADEAADRLAASDTSEEAIGALRTRCEAAELAYREAAIVVSRGRKAAASRLSDQITAELANLAMGGAAVAVNVRRRPAPDAATQLPRLSVDGDWVGAGAEGVDEVEITLRAHPEAPELPVQRGASGGELSRVMLAVEVVLAGTDPLPTMVFDEVDAGVGGRAAVEVGRTLARLARSHQVIVVTHLAQVAAFADRHLVVDKATQRAESSGSAGSTEADGAVSDQPETAPEGHGVTRSDIRAVLGAERLAELARMLSGADSTVARQHAAELLAGAVASRDEDQRGALSSPALGEPKARSRKAVKAVKARSSR